MQQTETVGLAVGVSSDSHTVFSKGLGLASEVPPEGVRADRSRFRWADLSTAVTGVLALRMHEQEIIRLDEPVNDLFPDEWPTEHCDSNPCRGPSSAPKPPVLQPIPDHHRAITLRMLLTHTAGIAGVSNGYDAEPLGPRPPEEANERADTGLDWTVNRFVFTQPLVELPNQKVSFSEFGLILAGWVLEKRANMAFDALVRRELGDELGNDALLVDSHVSPADDRVRGFYRDAQGAKTLRPDMDVSWKAPSGGLHGSVNTLMAFCNGVSSGSVFESEATARFVKEPLAPSLSSRYSAGFLVSDATAEQPAFVEQFGRVQQATAHLRLYNDSSPLCIGVLSNSEFGLTEALVAELRLAVQQEKPRTSAASPPTSSRQGPPPRSTRAHIDRNKLGPAMIGFLVLLPIALVGTATWFFVSRKWRRRHEADSEVIGGDDYAEMGGDSYRYRY